MDIDETIKLIKNKIEADNLVQKVRNTIKTAKWERQDLKEGFKKSFKPLIKSQNLLTENIITKNEETLQQLKDNQLALTEGLMANRLALTQGLAQLGALEPPDQEQEQDPDQEQDPGQEQDPDQEQEQDPGPGPETGAIPKKKTPVIDLEAKIDEDGIKYLSDMGFIRPNDFKDTTKEHLEELLQFTNKQIQFKNGEVAGLTRKKNKTQKDLEDITKAKKVKDYFRNYKDILQTYLSSIKYQVGKGVYFNPLQILDRLELLSGSILAGNNGVIPEFTKLLHLLHKMKVISNKQLNDLIKVYLTIK